MPRAAEGQYWAVLYSAGSFERATAAMNPEKGKKTFWEEIPPVERNRFGERPIFIVGSPRSGTTLMRSIVDAHPNIFCPPCETFFFNSLNMTFNNQIWENHYANLPYSREALISWLRNSFLDLFAHLGTVAGKSRLAEKTPSHVRVMDFIDEVFPTAQFVHMIRNGYDVMKSLKNTKWAAANMKRNATIWVESVTLGSSSGRRIGKDRYMELRYESLTADPESCLKKLCAFLEEDYSQSMMEFHLPENNSWGIGFEKSPVVRPLSEGDQGREYDDLADEESGTFRMIAGDLMEDLGYWSR